MDDVFHKHLDVCKQCADHPFDLCPIGAKLIEEAARELSPTGRRPSEPVFQNLPNHTELGQQILDAFRKGFKEGE